MNNRYTLMNKYTQLAELYVENDYITIDTVLNTLPSYINNINSWVQARFNIVGRENLLKMAKLAGISLNCEYITITKAISLTDTLWINDKLNPTTWDKINPYQNRISKIMADIAIDGIELYKNQNLESPSPQYRISGSVDKCIKRHNGKNYLYKTDGEKWSDLAGCRPYSEYFVTQLCNILNIKNSVNYSVIEHKTSEGYIKPYCICKLFTNEKQGFVEMCDTVYKNYTIEELYRTLDITSKKILRNMIILDSITLNIDRHMGNYGFLYDNDSFQIIGLAPIYDNDCSLGALTSIQDKTFDDAYNEIIYKHQSKMELGGYNEQSRKLMNRSIFNVLRQFQNNKIQLKKTNNTQGISDNRMEFINYIINRRIDEIVNYCSSHQ